MHLRKCKHCQQDFDIENKPSGWMANHTRWCNSNPKRQEYIEKLGKNGRNAVQLMLEAKRRSGKTNQYTKARVEGREPPVSPLIGISHPGTPHTEKTKQHLREKARLSKHRRLRKGTIVYSGVLLDSSWELALAIRLDDLNISWTRPDPVEYIDDEGLTRNYFPDFYLPDYDLYLDPKNKYAYETQKKKIDILLTTMKNLIIITTLDECKRFLPYQHLPAW